MRTMKFLLPLFMAIFMCGCSSSDEPSVGKDEKCKVSFHLDFGFKNASSMSRANADVYDDFYDEMIATKQLTPETFTVKFTSEDNNTTYDFYGSWGDDNIITLMEGNYKVTGTSSASGNYVQDKASLVFSQDITIARTTTSISLTAEYACFLLFFNKGDFTELSYTKTSSGSANNTVIDLVNEYQDYYYVFSRNLDTGYFYGERTNGSSFRFSSTSFDFEQGKYYFFNDASLTFEVPKMEAGN